MNKLISILFLIVTMHAAQVVIHYYELDDVISSLVDTHSDGIPDTDTSENSEDDTELDSNSLIISHLLGQKTDCAFDYKLGTVQLFSEIPNPPPEVS